MKKHSTQFSYVFYDVQTGEQNVSSTPALEQQ